MSNLPPAVEAEHASILATTADYIEAWLDGDVERMRGCLHPQLAKRAVYEHAGMHVLDEMTRDDMVAVTLDGEGRGSDRKYEATILDLFDGIATVRLLSSAFMDYVHLGRFADRWLIVNVLWQRR